MTELIVRADDLGYSEGVNFGIEKSVKDGIINNVGFMVCVPSSIHGWKLLKDADICLGMHTCISAGSPVSDPAHIPSLVREDGSFKRSSQYRNAGKDIVVLEEALIEVEAQYQAFRKITGKDPAYIDAHAVMSQNFMEAIQITAQKHHLNYLDLSKTDPVIYKNHKIYMHIESSLPDYDPSELIRRVCLHPHPDGYDLIVFHPGYIDQRLIDTSSLVLPRPREASVLSSGETIDWLEEHHVHLCRLDEIEPLFNECER